MHMGRSEAREMSRSPRIGIDWGGTKIEIIALDGDGREKHRERIKTPRNDYEGAIEAVRRLVDDAEEKLKKEGTVGVGMPGMIDPVTGLVRNANSTWMIGRPLQKDLEKALGRPVRCANDANCLALSEATDGAGAAQQVVFAAILGTGCGAGIAIGGKVHEGINGLAGEWGHTSLPYQSAEEYPGRNCYCGRRGCIETWISGTGLEADYKEKTGKSATALEIHRLATESDMEATACMARYEDRLARALAQIVNILDPDVIVLGGGMSKIQSFYETIPARITPYTFGKHGKTPILPAKHGDSSGVRGAAWLWELGDK
jgi:fructokinase